MNKSKSYTGNVYDDIKSNVIPGTYSKDKTTYLFPVITVKNKLEQISTYQIYVKVLDTLTDSYVPFTKQMLTSPVTQLPPNIVGYIGISNITHTGKERSTKPTIIKEGKNIGKINATTSVSQAIITAYSMYNLKVTKVEKPRQNGILPMLVSKLNASPKAVLSGDNLSEGIIIERKYDGVRALSHLTESDAVELYSRTGIPYVGMNHIETELKSIFKNNHNIYIDGEIYKHSYRLQDINGAISGKSRLDRNDLEYWIYDVYDTSNTHMGAYERKILLQSLINEQYSHIKLVPWTFVNSMNDINKYTEIYISEGYEGSILRKRNEIYEPSVNNRHSVNILKVKKFETAEFVVTGMKDGTRGKDVGAVIFICKTDTGLEFSAVPKSMTYEERYKLFKELQKIEDDNISTFDKYVKNQAATIQYSILSKDGKPQQPKFISLRLEIDQFDIINEIVSRM